MEVYFSHKLVLIFKTSKIQPSILILCLKKNFKKTTIVYLVTIFSFKEKKLHVQIPNSTNDGIIQIYISLNF